jgi:hypothetical protein
MSEKDVLYATLGGAAVVITLLVGFSTGWNLVTLLVGVALVGAVLALRFLLHVRIGTEPSVVWPQAPETPPVQLKVGPVSLETANPDFRVMFSATVLWRSSHRAEPFRAVQVRSPQPSVPPASVATTSYHRADHPGTAAGPAPPGPTVESASSSSAAESTPGHTPPCHDTAARSPAGQLRAERNGGSERVRHADPGALAAAAAVERAAEMVCGSPPADSGKTRQQLAKDLGWERTDPTGTVRWCAQDVELDLADPDDAERLRALSRLRKQVHEWEQKREHEKNLREYLGDDALTTGGTALVWWLARHLDDDQSVPAAVRLINDLSTLSMAAQDRANPDQAESPFVAPPLTACGPDGNVLGQDLASATHELLERLFPDSDDERTMFARSLASIAERSGLTDYATCVRTLFGVPDLDGDPPDRAGEEQ